jgi:signal transduction histidine kinase
MKFSRLHSSVRIILIYAAAASLWIFLSDAALEGIVSTANDLTRLQTYKGIVFVLVTSLLLYVLLRRELQRREAVEQELQRLNKNLEERVAERTAELQTANERLTRSERLRSKFIADASHSLRTPISSINLQLELLAQAPDGRHQKYVNGLRERILHLNALVDDVLDLAELEAFEFDRDLYPVNLAEVVEKVIHVHRVMAEDAGIALNFSASDDLPPVRGDGVQLTQAISNLLSNAIKYTPAGKVDVRVNYDAAQGTICLQVQDTGLGIDPADLPHLFRRFYRGRSVRSSAIPGTGLGLGIVQEVIDACGGQVGVQSVPGEGSTFTVWLPVIREQQVVK